jgi:hypothetical protein
VQEPSCQMETPLFLEVIGSVPLLTSPAGVFIDWICKPNRFPKSPVLTGCSLPVSHVTATFSPPFPAIKAE